ncbi:flavin-containing monooxygenase FMO GS-OX-like 9 [Cryptomeria japonica]|uniref:flavin-containing monooxygenase FMO GS-OX-like 9 n=1 Tax=Cryptomeria japonica TaxID=3369 RepID=UPI0027DA5BE8|nr:flavin-containing monooxygenase FMO GS-OX-like 9 [Cryptomeria japonica]
MPSEERSEYRRWNLCVIGAGPAGLIAARELSREEHSVTVYEQKHDVGGNWLYDPKVEDDDPLGLNPHRKVHSSIYASLRLISPRETMGLPDYPFSVKEGRDGRRFPSHTELLLFLKDFAQDFNLLPLISFNTFVEYVGMVAEEGGEGGKNIRWLVRCRRRVVSLEGAESEEVFEQVFDGVVVCNGHYTQPRIPQIPGMHRWPGRQIHSHNYRVPDPFDNEVVVVIGDSHSGRDISLELLRGAKEVHLSSKSSVVIEGLTKLQAEYPNFYIHSVIESLHDNGLVAFKDGFSVNADSILYCTGYSYSCPFLDTKGIVSVDRDHVGPLYEHIFPPLLAPSLSFIGIPKKIIAFPFFEAQSKWLAYVLSGKVALPSVKDMFKAVEDSYQLRDVDDVPKHYTHDIASFEYHDWLADQSGYPHFEDWKKDICFATFANVDSNIDTFRDTWFDQELLDFALSI